MATETTDRINEMIVRAEGLRGVGMPIDAGEVADVLTSLLADKAELLEALDWLLASVEVNAADERHPDDKGERLTLAKACARAAIAKATE